MHLAQIWRYPVKSMGGERLASALVAAQGIAGDRLMWIADEEGELVTSRSRPLLLRHRATVGPDGQPLVDGRSWRDPGVARDVVAAAGPGSLLMSYEDGDLDRFDVLPLLVVTDGALAAFGHDPRRLRPNLIIGGVTGLAERGWEGRSLRIGGALVQLVSLRRRCIMTTFDPDTAAQDVEVLKEIHRRFGGRLALDTRVIEPGPIAEGDPVVLI